MNGCKLLNSLSFHDRIYLVHSHGEVLHTMRNAFRLKATSFLESIGIDLVLGDKVERVENGVAYLSSGKQLTDVDMHIVGHPLHGNAVSFMPKESLDARGYVKVNEKFEVEVKNISLYLCYFRLK